MKILHVASFTGNIGDNASHFGANRVISSLLNTNYIIEPLEIRKAYRNYSLVDKWQFDDNFASQSNKYDLLLIGGGGFLDYFIDDSITGTTLNIKKTILDRIKVPILLWSMGCLQRKANDYNNIPKLKFFLDELLGKKNTYITVRNDGSSYNIKKHLGDAYSKEIPEVLDNGFFYENDGTSFIPSDKHYVLINLSLDQLSFANHYIKTIKKESFMIEMLNIVEYILDETDLNIVFSPHIISDYEPITYILNSIDYYKVASRIIVTPYAQNHYGCKMIFSAYKNSILTIGMRFHANVCSIAMNKPCIGIAATDKVASLFESMNKTHDLVKADETYSVKTINLIDKYISCNMEQAKNANNYLSCKQKDTMETYYNLFCRIGLI